MSFLESLNTLDTLILTIILAAIVHGLVVGLAKVGASCVASIAGLGFGFWYYDIPGRYLSRLMGTTASNIAGTT